jgi:predicted ferric reductase
MIITKYKAKIVSIDNPFEGIYTLELMSLGRKFKYAPGQFLHLATGEYNPSDAWPESRCFSMQSSPSEKNIKITYAVKGVYTREMAEKLRVDAEVWLKLPYGDLFTQEHNKNNTVFIAGGTGITPFLSLFTDPSFVTYSLPCLYAGFKSKHMNLYAYEIDKATQINPALSVNLVYQNKQGMLNIGHILQRSNTGCSFFLSGPPEMMKKFRSYLIGNGVPHNQIKADDWE